jgi:hypothetical protein
MRRLFLERQPRSEKLRNVFVFSDSLLSKSVAKWLELESLKNYGKKQTIDGDGRRCRLEVEMVLFQRGNFCANE